MTLANVEHEASGAMASGQPDAMKAPLLSVRGLKVAFRQRADGWFGHRRRPPVEIVQDISFDIAQQSMVALVGESGSGKSVTAMAVLGLLPGNAVVDGDSVISFAGRDLLRERGKMLRALRGKDIAMIFQDPMTALNPVLTVGYQIGEVLREHKHMSAADARQRSIALLKEVGIVSPETKVDAYPSQLSGGQQQRVMIAMAIACEPKLLIADEPTTALDVTVQKQIMDLLRHLQASYRMSILFITHDLALVGESADTVVVMRRGKIVEQGPVARIFGQPEHPYTKALLHCRPQIGRRFERLPVVEDFLKEDQATPKASCTDGDDMPAARALRASARVESRTLAHTQDIVLDVRGLNKSFPVRAGLLAHHAVPAVRDVSFTLPRGTTLGVVGESGSGKSTMAWSLLRLHEADSGQVWFDGQDVLAMSGADFAPLKRRMQIIFQNPYASLNPRFTVGQILQEPMRIHAIGVDDEERDMLARGWLQKVGLPSEAMQRYPHEFSGGQRQRIAIARCLTMQPEILVCDESVSALDVSVQAQVLNLLVDLQLEFGLSYIFISHDLAVIQHIADQVLVMRHGQVVEVASSEALFAQPQHRYTQSLLSAIPRGIVARE